MNGFEPLRRRIIDYTEAGQWSEVYDGPLEDCESEKLKAENAKLVMKLNAEHIVRQNMERENAKLRELVRTFYHCTTSGECDECPINGGGPVHLMPDTICDTIHDRMRELGVDA